MLLELICSVAFTIEVIFRLAVVDGLWPLITDVCLYIDIIAILPFVFDLVCVATGDFGPLPEFEGEPEPEVPDNGLAVHTNPFDWLRVARLLRLFKLARHFEGSRVIVDTLKRSFYALLVPLLFLLTGVIIFAGLLTYVEQDGEARDDFGNILKSSWFVLVTFSTVGYGDVPPRTAWGQLVTSVAILCGVLFMAMPITIVGNNFATVWEEKEAVAVVLKMQVSNGPPPLPPPPPQLPHRLHRHLPPLQELLLSRQLGARDVIRVFCEFDASGDGALDLAEFKAALGVMDIRMPLKKVRKLFKLFDQDGNNSVDYMEVRRDPSQTSARPAPL